MHVLYVNQPGGFLNSTLFFAFVTLFVGLSAYRIYAKQRADSRREAATVVLSDVKAVVSKIRTIKQDFERDNFLVESRFLLRSNNWHTYKYRLIPYFTLDQWGSLDNFFADVEKYDKAVEINDSYFDANAQQVWVSLHKHYLRVLEAEGYLPAPILDPTAPLPLPPDLLAKIQYFTNQYIKNAIATVAYLPQRPINMARDALVNINKDILVSTTGTRLTELSKMPRPLWTRLRGWISRPKKTSE